MRMITGMQEWLHWDSGVVKWFVILGISGIGKVADKGSVVRIIKIHLQLSTRTSHGISVRSCWWFVNLLHCRCASVWELKWLELDRWRPRKHIYVFQLEKVAVVMHCNLRLHDVSPVVLHFNCKAHSLMHLHTRVQWIRAEYMTLHFIRFKPTLQPVAAYAQQSYDYPGTYVQSVASNTVAELLQQTLATEKPRKCQKYPNVQFLVPFRISQPPGIYLAPACEILTVGQFTAELLMI